MAEAAAVPKKKGLSSGMQILIAMVAAILAGIFFGGAMKQIEFEIGREIGRAHV